MGSATVVCLQAREIVHEVSPGMLETHCQISGVVWTVVVEVALLGFLLGLDMVFVHAVIDIMHNMVLCGHKQSIPSCAATKFWCKSVLCS